MESKTPTFVTICATNYLGQATLLARSLFPIYGRCLHLVLAERTLPNCPLLAEFESVHLATDICPFDLEAVIFSYGIVEACTAIKATVLKYFLQPESWLVYLDPDIFAYSAFEELYSLSWQQSIVATPHLTEIETNWAAIFENELRVMRHGIFNLGFLALRGSESSTNFLKWFEKRLLNLCLDEPSSGFFVDQKWFDLAIGIFDVGVLRHPGYNIANWNASIRRVRLSGDSLICGNNDTVRFVHHSGVLINRDIEAYENTASRNVSILLDLRTRYLNQLESIKIDRQIEWSYARYLSGEKIARRARRNWAFRPRTTHHPNPFTASNSKMIYLGHMDHRDADVSVQASSGCYF